MTIKKFSCLLLSIILSITEMIGSLIMGWHMCTPSHLHWLSDTVVSALYFICLGCLFESLLNWFKRNS